MCQDILDDKAEVTQEVEYVEVPAGAELASDKIADLVEYLVCNLVDDVDSVVLEVTESDTQTLIEITCADSDTGKIIGRRGRTIKSIRTLARALGQRIGTSVEVEVLG